MSSTEFKSLRDAREELDRALIQAALLSTYGNITASAIRLGISRRTMYDLLDKYGFRKSKNKN